MGDDPAYDLPAGERAAAGALLNVPARLLDLKVRLCFREAHARCVRDSDFPWMAAYFFATFKQSLVMFGLEPTVEQIGLAHGYLRRCGRYRATIDLADVEADPGDFERLERYGLEIELEWKPGPGDYGMVGSTVEGEGEHRDIDFAFGQAGCTRETTRTRTDRARERQDRAPRVRHGVRAHPHRPAAAAGASSAHPRGGLRRDRLSVSMPGRAGPGGMTTSATRSCRCSCWGCLMRRIFDAVDSCGCRSRTGGDSPIRHSGRS